MKKAKKMALQAMVCAAFAAAMVLAGCSTEEGGDSDIIETIKGNNATIDADNTTEYANRRGFKSTDNQKWSEAAYEIKIEESTGNNVMGFMFNETENKDGTKNFFLFGVRLNSAKTGLEAYLSYFPDVDEKKNLTSNADSFYGTDTNKEVVIKKGSTGAYFPLVSNQKSVVIYVTQEKDTRQGNPYIYVVKAYKKSGAGDSLSDDDIIFTERLTNYPNTENAGKKWDNYMGFYANVKKGSHLKGSWTLLGSKLEKAVEVAEAE